jgi:hypothetical protein
MPKKQEFSYTFEGKKLGLEVKDRQSAVGIEVVSIVNDSPCLGIVQKGDIIFAVGQHDLRQLHYSDFLKFVKESTRPLTVKFFRPYRQKYDIGSTVLLDSTESDDDEEFHEKVKIISFDDLRGLYKVECEDGDIEKAHEADLHPLRPGDEHSSSDDETSSASQTDSSHGDKQCETHEGGQKDAESSVIVPVEERSEPLRGDSGRHTTPHSRDVDDDTTPLHVEAQAPHTTVDILDDAEEHESLLPKSRSPSHPKVQGQFRPPHADLSVAASTMEDRMMLVEVQYGEIKLEVDRLKRVCHLFGQYLESGRLSAPDQSESERRQLLDSIGDDEESGRYVFAMSHASAAGGAEMHNKGAPKSKEMIGRRKTKIQRRKKRVVKPIDPNKIKFGKQGLLQRGNTTAGLCSGGLKRSGAGLCVANLLLTPFLLVIHSIRIYVFPCMWAYLFRLCCWGASRMFGSCILYKDSDFPADETSLGEYEAQGKKVYWVRGDDILAPLEDLDGDGKIGKNERRGGHAHLFQNGVTPSDICQGMLGDCWLLSAISCMAEFPGSIENLFAEKLYSHRGKYTVRLFDPISNEFVCVTIDDRFPCQNKEKPQPMFTKPNPKGGELWTMLLEKAFAKLCGSYGALEGGYSLWALHVMTGDPVAKWSYSSDCQKWEPFELRIDDEKDGTDSCAFYTHSSFEKHNNKDFFDVLLEYDQQQCIIGAGTRGVDNTRKEGRGDQSAGGIVPGHAYSIIKVRKIGKHRLLCLRNPWGKFEWKGDWSDGSQLWDKETIVRLQIRPDRKNDDDGIFWMSCKCTSLSLSL